MKTKEFPEGGETHEETIERKDKRLKEVKEKEKQINTGKVPGSERKVAVEKGRGNEERSGSEDEDHREEDREVNCE